MANDKEDDVEYLTLDELLDMDDEDATEETRWAFMARDINDKNIITHNIHIGPKPPRK